MPTGGGSASTATDASDRKPGAGSIVITSIANPDASTASRARADSAALVMSSFEPASRS
jgi:hypothetical protein